MSEKYTPGERIRITIDATVLDQPTTDEIEYQYPTALGTVEGLVVLSDSPVTVERLAPAEWPPRPGDKWRDRLGSAWFAFYGLEAREVFMIPADPVRGPLSTPTPDEAMHKVGPLSLVHREDEQADEYIPCGCDHHGDHAGCYPDCECAS